MDSLESILQWILSQRQRDVHEASRIGIPTLGNMDDPLHSLRVSTFYRDLGRDVRADPRLQITFPFAEKEMVDPVWQYGMRNLLEQYPQHAEAVGGPGATPKSAIDGWMNTLRASQAANPSISDPGRSQEKVARAIANSILSDAMQKFRAGGADALGALTQAPKFAEKASWDLGERARQQHRLGLLQDLTTNMPRTRGVR